MKPHFNQPGPFSEPPTGNLSAFRVPLRAGRINVTDPPEDDSSYAEADAAMRAQGESDYTENDPNAGKPSKWWEFAKEVGEGLEKAGKGLKADQPTDHGEPWYGAYHGVPHPNVSRYTK